MHSQVNTAKLYYPSIVYQSESFQEVSFSNLKPHSFLQYHKTAALILLNGKDS